MSFRNQLLILLLIVGKIASAQSTNPMFQQALADSLGADQYGMKNYVLVILKTGTTKISDKAKRDSLFRGHMANIGRLANSGQLIVAGPMEKNDKQYEGIFILNVKTIAEANELLITDPAIKARLLDPELYQWYGSAALPLYLKYHEVVKKTDF